MSLVNAATGAVVGTTTVGSSPFGVAVEPSGNRAYVTNHLSAQLSILDGMTGALIRTVDLGAGLRPVGVAVTADGAKVLVAIQLPATLRRLAVYDVAADSLREITVGNSPTAVATHPTLPVAYVTNQLSNTVSVVDTASETVVTTLTGFSQPFAVAVNATGTRLYVTNLGDNTVREIDTSTLQTVWTYTVLARPFGVAVRPQGDRAYVTNIDNRRLSVLDTSSREVSTIGVGRSPWGVAVDPSGSRVFVANFEDNTLSVVDAASNTVVQTVAVGQAPVAFGVFVRPGAAP